MTDTSTQMFLLLAILGNLVNNSMFMGWTITTFNIRAQYTNLWYFHVNKQIG
jgi:hypothetical protein